MRFVRDVGPGDVGARVTARWVAGTRHAEAVGRLERWHEGRLTVRRRDGSVSQFAEADLVALKRLPARRALDVPVRELERIAALGWRGLTEERLGGWLLRAAGGWTGRANSALPLGDPGVPLTEAVDEVERWYAARDLPPQLQVPLPYAEEVDAESTRRGWANDPGASVLVTDLAGVTGPPDGLVVDERPSAQWLAAYHYRGGPLPPVAPEVLLSADRPAFLSLPPDGDPQGPPLAVARVCLDEGWLGVTAVETAPQARRRGLATRLMQAALAWGRERGAAHAYLQVAQGNTAGRALYDRLGFAEHHRYVYRRAGVRGRHETG